MSCEQHMHETVLLQEAVDLLVTNSSGAYVDATFGRGGHSSKILEALDKDGSLIAIDKDLEAISAAQSRFVDEERFSIVHGSFADIREHLRVCGQEKVSGVLADLGVSSPQLDNAERGFSFMNDGPLDMRMDTTRGVSAAQWIKEVDEKEMVQVFFDYGEEKFARKIARGIKEALLGQEIDTTAKLSKIVKDANPSWEKHKHPATRVFQAIRIKVNDELSDLERLLDEASESLAVGGRLVVISFHSLEDRIVKRFMREKAKGDAPPPGVPVFEKDIVRGFKLVGKAIKPSKAEIENNVRAR
ncbi:16S rRNA (cytosine(1402)-N(4))-methyltransferase RsmH, partial [Oleiphilus sp. HI0117]